MQNWPRLGSFSSFTIKKGATSMSLESAYLFLAGLLAGALGACVLGAWAVAAATASLDEDSRRKRR
jgi:hypothetical protein